MTVPRGQVRGVTRGRAMDLPKIQTVKSGGHPHASRDRDNVSVQCLRAEKALLSDGRFDFQGRGFGRCSLEKNARSVGAHFVHELFSSNHDDYNPVTIRPTVSSNPPYFDP